MLELEQAIRISKILCQAPEERLPMILSVFEKADVSIDGLEELEEWKALKDQAYIIDVNEFMEEIKKAFPTIGDCMNIPVKEFSEFCRKQNIKANLAKRLLARHGFIVPDASGSKLEYTKTVYKDGKATRCVVVWKEPQKNG